MMAAGVGDPLRCKDMGIMALISSCNVAVGEIKLRQAQVRRSMAVAWLYARRRCGASQL